MKKLLLPLLVFLIASCTKGTYENPLRTSSGNLLCVADPCVYKVDDTYFLTCSAENGFTYYTSKDLVVWDSCGMLFEMPEDCNVHKMLWASEVAMHNEKFYLTFSGWDEGSKKLVTCLAISENPRGPFTLKYCPWIELENDHAIDSHLFFDTDGQSYVYFSENGPNIGEIGGGALRMAKLKEDMSSIDGEILHVNDEMQEWETRSYCRNVSCNEAPTVFMHNGIYYMTYSSNETHMGDYAVGVQTAPSPLGPWKKADYNPILQTTYDAPEKSEGGLPIVDSPGHNGIVLAPNGKDLYLIYHRHAPWVKEFPSNNRVTCLDRMWFDEEGRICTSGPSYTPQPKP